MEVKSDIPGEIKNILNTLSKMERIVLEDPRTYQSGENIVNKIFHNGEYRKYQGQGQEINVIPGGVSDGCQLVLLVAIGERRSEDVEKRILQAIEHINVKCSGTTKYVIFWAAKWESTAWMKHRDSFRNGTVILKLFGIDPIVLR